MVVLPVPSALGRTSVCSLSLIWIISPCSGHGFSIRQIGGSRQVIIGSSRLVCVCVRMCWLESSFETLPVIMTVHSNYYLDTFFLKFYGWTPKNDHLSDWSNSPDIKVEDWRFGSLCVQAVFFSILVKIRFCFPGNTYWSLLFLECVCTLVLKNYIYKTKETSSKCQLVSQLVVNNPECDSVIFWIWKM